MYHKRAKWIKPFVIKNKIKFHAEIKNPNIQDLF